MEKETTQPADSPESKDGGGADPQGAQAGEAQTGEAQTGEAQTGEAQTDEGQTGEAQTGEAQELPIEERLKKAEEETQRYLDNWRRAEADLQNVKRRAEQDRTESARYAGASLIINILPIVDDFERAFQSLDSHVAGMTWFDGVRLIYRKLLALLESAGVQPIKTEGETFDPKFHEAVAHAEGEENKVISEVQRGYLLHDRVLRPAMVVVGKGSGDEEKKETEGEPANG
ncbi:MAG: nucleotide exchange factor GrpE [Chloroflexi bacterium]|nr:nucleotide exchange factor GrpE [Chloroflexota bacterium]